MGSLTFHPIPPGTQFLSPFPAEGWNRCTSRTAKVSLQRKQSVHTFCPVLTVKKDFLCLWRLSTKKFLFNPRKCVVKDEGKRGKKGWPLHLTVFKFGQELKNVYLSRKRKIKWKSCATWQSAWHFHCQVQRVRITLGCGGMCSAVYWNIHSVNVE